MSFSFVFYLNLTNRESTKEASLLYLFEGCNFKRGEGMFVFGILILVGVTCVNPCLVYC